MTNEITYLDYNATAPVRPQVAHAVFEALQLCGNPSSIHSAGRAARKSVQTARDEIAALIGATNAQVIFTSGGTEANHLAIRGARVERILVSAIEHDSVLAADPWAEIIPVLPSGVVDLNAMREMLALDTRTALVSVMLANNETGILQPVTEAAGIAHSYGALLHCDAVQAAGKIDVNFAALGADMLSLSAHKLGGPQGVGALVVRKDMMLDAQLHGGRQEHGLRAGTENVPGIVGFGVAAKLAGIELKNMAQVSLLRDRLEAGAAQIAPYVIFFGADAARLPNTSCFALPGLSSESQVMSFDLSEIAISAGAACSSGKVTRSKVLHAMGVNDDVANCAVRVSLGWDSRAEDVDAFLQAWEILCGRVALRRAS